MLSKKTYYQLKIGRIFELSTQTTQAWTHCSSPSRSFARCRQHVHWNLNMLINVILSDESRYCLWQLDCRFKMWKRHGERYADCCTDRVTAFLISTKNKACHHWISIHRDTEMRYGIASTRGNPIWDRTLSSKMATFAPTNRIYHWLPPEFAFSPVLTCGISLRLTFVPEWPTQLYWQTYAKCWLKNWIPSHRSVGPNWWPV